MDQFTRIKDKQSSANLDENKISKAGCRYLSKANWKKITYIRLGILKIT